MSKDYKEGYKDGFKEGFEQAQKSKSTLTYKDPYWTYCDSTDGNTRLLCGEC